MCHLQTFERICRSGDRLCYLLPSRPKHASQERQSVRSGRGASCTIELGKRSVSSPWCEPTILRVPKHQTARVVAGVPYTYFTLLVWGEAVSPKAAETIETVSVGPKADHPRHSQGGRRMAPGLYLKDKQRALYGAGDQSRRRIWARADIPPCPSRTTANRVASSETTSPFEAVSCHL